MFFVYILRSDTTGNCYIGSTDNILRRFREHSGNQEKATKNKGPWEMIHWEAFPTLSRARMRELYLKTGAGYRWRKNNGLIVLK